LPAAGRRAQSGGSLEHHATYGHYWSSTQAFNTNGSRLGFSNVPIDLSVSSNKAEGLNARCVRYEIKEETKFDEVNYDL